MIWIGLYLGLIQNIPFNIPIKIGPRMQNFQNNEVKRFSISLFKKWQKCTKLSKQPFQDSRKWPKAYKKYAFILRKTTELRVGSGRTVRVRSLEPSSYTIALQLHQCSSSTRAGQSMKCRSFAAGGTDLFGAKCDKALAHGHCYKEQHT